MDDLKAKLGDLRKQLRNTTDFPKIYKFVFNFLKGEAARNVNIEYAVSMWELLLKERYGSKIQPFLERWVEFLNDQKDNNGLNGIKKDEWNSLIDFFEVKGIDPNNMKASEEDCWPILFDGFLEFLNPE